MRVRILLVEDHRVMRAGLRAVLDSQESFEIVGEADDGKQAVERCVELAPDVVVMDVGMRGMNGIEATRRITDRTEARVLALSAHADKRYVANMLRAGAVGYVLKEAAAEDLIRAVRAVTRGEHYLSPQITGVLLERWRRAAPSGSVYQRLGSREREVLQLLAEGGTSKEIAQRLSLSPKTVETHRRNISRKLGLHSVAELTKYAVREGLTTLD